MNQQNNTGLFQRILKKYAWSINNKILMFTLSYNTDLSLLKFSICVQMIVESPPLISNEIRLLYIYMSMEWMRKGSSISPRNRSVDYTQFFFSFLLLSLNDTFSI